MRREECFGQVPERRGCRDQLRQVILGTRRDQNDRRRLRRVGDPPSELEPALGSQIDVDECDVRPELLNSLESLGAGRRDANDRDSLPLQQLGGSREKARTIVHDQASRGHAPRMPERFSDRMGASRKMLTKPSRRSRACFAARGASSAPKSGSPRGHCPRRARTSARLHRRRLVVGRR